MKGRGYVPHYIEVPTTKTCFCITKMDIMFSGVNHLIFRISGSPGGLDIFGPFL